MTILAFTGGLSVLAGTVLGLVPAWQTTRPDVVSTLKQDTAGGGQPGQVGGSKVYEIATFVHPSSRGRDHARLLPGDGSDAQTCLPSRAPSGCQTIAAKKKMAHGVRFRAAVRVSRTLSTRRTPRVCRVIRSISRLSISDCTTPTNVTTLR